ncbi:serine/threonine kinase PKN8 [Plesiocystis pacifica SIR-1]|uniref:Serine/threonine kinase PKN8 n=1 Tax=Plesiocystis pacifica SIR-1 TaxID=391625 RepID=A6GJL9_9BACT|nr:serine/threonine-protein kinase [Plesiocystis pacifica]EDM73929.1 serine/threonine kinase PKN8 [Plesiocystis pacifica SIR-1]
MEDRSDPLDDGDLEEEDELGDVPSTAGLSIALQFEMTQVWMKTGLPYEDVLVAKRFKLLRRVGIGSYGRVYEAQDLELGRIVAVKVMPIGDPEVAAREGKALAAVDHPNIVRIYDHGQDDDYRWLVLDFLDGPKLSDWCQERPTRAEVLARFLEAGEGLDAAHRRGLVHRDFKPGNVMLRAGKAIVTDFGLARNLESLKEYESEHLIASGTIQFMSRERLQGSPGDERGDQFAFCVSLWWALSSEYPFGPAEGLQQYFEALGEQPRGGQNIPRRVRKVLARGMAELPGDRWPTMTVLLTALRTALRRRVWPWVAGLIVVGVGVGIVLSASPWDLDVPTELELSEVDEMSLDIIEGLEEDDVDVVVQALSNGYVAARREGSEADFLPAVLLAATGLEGSGRVFEAQFAWSMVARLRHEIGDEEGTEAAKQRFRALGQ